MLQPFRPVSQACADGAVRVGFSTTSSAPYYCSGCGAYVTTGSCASCGPILKTRQGLGRGQGRGMSQPRRLKDRSAPLSSAAPNHLRMPQIQRPSQLSADGAATTPWVCPFCESQMPSSTSNCLQCNHVRPVEVQADTYRSAWAWSCPSCGYLQHGWRRACRNCTALKPLRCAMVSPQTLKMISPAQQVKQLPDYVCVACNKPTSAQNQRCLSCGQPRLYWPTGMRLQINDWACTGCGSLTMSTRDHCIVCFEPQSKFPIRVLRPGWWVCADCGGTNIPGVDQCFHCKAYANPLASESQLRIPAEQRRKLILQRELAYQKELRQEIEDQVRSSRQRR